jgi:phosphopantothenate synthetase
MNLITTKDYNMALLLLSSQELDDTDREAYTLLVDNYKKMPTLKQIVKYLKEELEAINDPLYNACKTSIFSE